MKWLTGFLLAAALSTTAEAAPRHFPWGLACNNEASAVAVIEASHSNAAGQFFSQEVGAGKCKYFGPQRPIGVFSTKIVRDDLTWGDGDPMFVIEGRDKHGVQVFIWMPKTAAYELGIGGTES